MRKLIGIMTMVLALIMLLAVLPAVSAGDPTGGETLLDPSTGEPDPFVAMNFIWLILCAALVFFMQAGFAMLEAGFSRSKNVANVLMKNMVDFAAGAMAWFCIGAVLMLGASYDIGGFGLFGTDGWLMMGDFYDVSYGLTWVFMLVFAATAATIVSGAVAERMKFSTYIIVSIVITAIIYPIYGHWVWGGGWLMASDFINGITGTMDYGHLDFAGSGVVHAVGGYLALAGVLVLGPRIGRFGKNGEPKAIPGHNLGYAMLGAFILIVGWFGFNAGSTLAADQLRMSIVMVNTLLACAAGALTGLAITWYKFGTADMAMTINGSIAGLVAITAPCAWVAPWAAIVIGIMAGFIVCYGFWLLESKGIDDVVGAIPVHAFNGTWGLIALGIFADGTYGNYATDGQLVTGLLYGGSGFFVAELVGAFVSFAWAFGLGLVLFTVLKRTIGIRVTPEEEIKGLDACEHSVSAYPDFISSDVSMEEIR